MPVAQRHRSLSEVLRRVPSQTFDAAEFYLSKSEAYSRSGNAGKAYVYLGKVIDIVKTKEFELSVPGTDSERFDTHLKFGSIILARQHIYGREVAILEFSRAADILSHGKIDHKRLNQVANKMIECAMSAYPHYPGILLKAASILEEGGLHERAQLVAVMAYEHYLKTNELDLAIAVAESHGLDKRYLVLPHQIKFEKIIDRARKETRRPPFFAVNILVEAANYAQEHLEASQMRSAIIEAYEMLTSKGLDRKTALEAYPLAEELARQYKIGEEFVSKAHEFGKRLVESEMERIGPKDRFASCEYNPNMTRYELRVVDYELDDVMALVVAARYYGIRNDIIIGLFAFVEKFATQLYRDAVKDGMENLRLPHTEGRREVVGERQVSYGRAMRSAPDVSWDGDAKPKRDARMDEDRTIVKTEPVFIEYQIPSPSLLRALRLLSEAREMEKKYELRKEVLAPNLREQIESIKNEISSLDEKRKLLKRSWPSGNDSSRYLAPKG